MSGQNTPRCPGVRKDGAPCRATPTRDGRCPWHSGAFTAEEKLGWATKGGLRNRPGVMPDVPNPRLKSMKDRLALREEVSGLTLRGELDPELSRVVLKAADDVSADEDRLRKARVPNFEGSIVVQVMTLAPDGTHSVIRIDKTSHQALNPPSDSEILSAEGGGGSLRGSPRLSWDARQ